MSAQPHPTPAPDGRPTAIVVVASKHGTTAEIGRRIAQALGGAELVNLADGAPQVAGYDTVVLGTPIYAGQPMSQVKAFARTLLDDGAAGGGLDGARLGLFASGVIKEPQERAKELADAFPAPLRDRAAVTEFLPGGYRFAALKAFERFIIKRVTKSDADVDLIDDDAITAFAAALRA